MLSISQSIYPMCTYFVYVCSYYNQSYCLFVILFKSILFPWQDFLIKCTQAYNLGTKHRGDLAQIRLVHLWIHKYFTDDSSVNFSTRIFFIFFKNVAKNEERPCLEKYRWVVRKVLIVRQVNSAKVNITNFVSSFWIALFYNKWIVLTNNIITRAKKSWGKKSYWFVLSMSKLDYCHTARVHL